MKAWSSEGRLRSVFSPVGYLLPCQFPFLSCKKRLEDISTQRIVEATAKDEITLVSVSVQNKTRQLGQRSKKHQYLRNTKFKKKASVRQCEGKAREKGDTRKAKIKSISKTMKWSTLLNDAKRV